MTIQAGVTSFILSTLTSGADVRLQLGSADYSYHFVMEGYRRALDPLGQTIVVADAAEAKARYEAARAGGQNAVFFCFAPPHRVPLGLQCPVICVFAWEFGTIPAEPLDDDPRSDWTYTLAQVGRAIALSSRSAATVRAAIGPACRIAAIAAPVDPRLARLGRRKPGSPGAVSLSGTIYDSRVYGPYFGRPPLRRTEPPALEPQSAPHPAGLRRLATQWRRMARRGSPPAAPPPEPSLIEPWAEVQLTEIVYTSVFNPMDGRKNWQDLLTAFCYAHRSQPNATLVMKMVHDHRDSFEILLDILTRALSPFQCRVVALHGWMQDAEYDALIDATDYYVNCSTGEGQCLPLMEFMTAGRPAIAPDHTAMEEYVTKENSFVLRYTDEYNVWPQDPRDLYRTTRHRLDWGSLHDAFQASYAVATCDPARYAAMADASSRAAAHVCGLEAVRDKLQACLPEFMA